MTKFNAFAGAAIAAALCSYAASAGAGAPTSASFTVDLPNYAVTDINFFDLGSPFAVLARNDLSDPITAAAGGQTILTNTYPTIADIPIPGFHFIPAETFLLGVTSNLPGDAPGQQHLVLFTNDAFATSAQSIAFGTLFPNTNELTLINDLETTDTSGIFNFAGGDASTGPNGSIFFTPGDDFTVIAFSGGQTIGTGTSAFEGGVPEPASWAMMLMGFCALGAALRSRRKTAVAA